MTETRVEFLTPEFREDELTCKDAPSGQLPYTASAAEVAARIVGIDEAGEDCRQKLSTIRQKIDNFKAEAEASKKKK